MELRSGMPLLAQQYTALLRKNFILTMRQKRSVVLRLISPFFFILILFYCQKSMEDALKNNPLAYNLTDPTTLSSIPIPRCEEKFFILKPCYDFIWSGNGSSRIQSIVTQIMANNPGRPIPSSKVRSFGTWEDVNDWLFRHPMRCPGALHFMDMNDTVISYGIQTNTTDEMIRGQYEDPTFKFQVPLQISAEREIARSLFGDPNFSWTVGLKQFARPAVQNIFGSSVDDDIGLAGQEVNAIKAYGPVFFLALAMFGFVLQVGSLVTEKELKLRQAMTMMGLYDTAYWLSWITWEGVITLISSILTVSFGMIFRFNFFLWNSFVVVFLVFFLFQLSMMGFAFMIASFLSKSSSSTTVGFGIFVISVVTAAVAQMQVIGTLKKKYQIMWSIFPPNPFFDAIIYLSRVTSQSDGISWKKLSKCPASSPECYITIKDIYIRLVSTFFMWFFLAVYFDNVLPNAVGVRKPFYYFLKPGYWTGKDGNKGEGSAPKLNHITADDNDVREEENTVKQQAREGLVDPKVAVQIRGLVKMYPSQMKIGCHRICCCCCCCTIKKTAAYHAVKGLWVNFEKDQLFCLLGPNGAGKTTTISCLTGISPVTGGDALIYGNSVRSSIGMSNIRRMIGVCPQFDILWDTLSGQEHLQIFASIKGLPTSSIASVARKLLAEVKLTEVAIVRSGSYSGGMKRRLSVAIALIGDPKLVILDEPTTGMDPVTRRHVWDVIEEAKKGRAIILTTHSMEEADILSDRIGIMAKGTLRCIGTSIWLKSRFGTGFIANVSFSETVNAAIHHEEVKKFFKHHLDVSTKEESGSYLTFVIPHDKEDVLTRFFRELESRKREFGISDLQLSLTTLEEVFLNIAKKAELEAALAEGKMTTLTLTSGTSLQIPLGARFIGIPGTESEENPKGLMVEVFWEQDDGGALCITDQSPETPVPAHAQLQAPPGGTAPTTLGQGGTIYGVVVDLD